MQYVEVAKEKRRKAETAAKFGEYLQLCGGSAVILFCSCAVSLKQRRLAWRIWCEYVLVRREKRRVQHEVDQWAITRTVRCED